MSDSNKGSFNSIFNIGNYSLRKKQGNNNNTSTSNSSPGYTNKSNGKSSTTTTVIYVVLGVLLIAVLIGVIYAIVAAEKRKKSSYQYIIDKPQESYNLQKSVFEIPQNETEEEFSYTMWIYVHNWTGGWKNIIVRGSDPGLMNANDDSVGSNTFERYPGLWLYPDTNALHARINTLSSANEGCDIKNIPLQKWVHIGYVLNNRTVDMYIDGKLERSCVLRGIPNPPSSNKLYVCGGEKGNTYFGKISKLVYFKYALKPDQIYSLYSSGPN